MEGWRRYLNEQEGGAINMEKLLGSEYTKFVGWLGNNINDPKVRKFISSGLADGADPSDDMFGFSEAAPAVANLIPTQNEVDIDKSLAFPLVKTQGKGFVQNVSTNGPFTLGDPIVIFNGKWIIDGHHRWSQLYACNKNAAITAVNITIEGVAPLNALKAVQMSIGAQTGKIPVQSVEGTNLLKIDDQGLAQWILKNVSVKATNAMYKAGEDFINKLKQGGGTAEQLPSGTKSPHGAPETEMNEWVLTEISKNRFHKMMVTQILPRFISSNIESMQQTSQPVKGAGPRDFMPQTGGVDWAEPLKKGQIDVKPPFARAAE
tara:strand:+ start:460 stop:1416 length:957 start_codon:yes stop_codon:yes gene_type:complete